MQCGYFDAGVCWSCTLMGQPYQDQLSDKQQHAAELLAGHPELQWMPPIASPESDFRSKAKMVVGGTIDRPTIGILDAAGRGVDLRNCGICSPGLRAVFPVLAEFVRTARVAPYDVPARRGELKFLLLTEAAGGNLMLRFVLRSRESLHRIRRQLPELIAKLPQLAVVSANLQPEHKAVIEGDSEIHLYGPESLPLRLGGPTLQLRSRSFFQTNNLIAAALYRTAAGWAEEAQPRSIWDLYCGVGGFALHLAAPGRTVVGVEISSEAVASAQRSAAEAGVAATFLVGDAGEVFRESHEVPDLVVVNPPRAGIGPDLASTLQSSGVGRVLYSSCNSTTLARDLAAMPSLRPIRGVVLDMFPQTRHYEVLVDLVRRRGRR